MIKMNLAQNSISTEMLEHIYSGLREAADEIEKSGCGYGCSDGDDDEDNVIYITNNILDKPKSTSQNFINKIFKSNDDDENKILKY